jgi:hypothetical protein
MLTTRVVRFCPFGGMSNELRLRRTTGPKGTTEELRITNPVKLFRLVTIICEVPDPPRIIDRVIGFAFIVKLGPPGRLLKPAV